MSKRMIKVLPISFCLFTTFWLSAQTWFQEVSDSVGLSYIYPGNEFQMAGGGLMIIDVNNDGWEDLYQSGGVFESKLWLNESGKFVDKTEDFGLNVLNGYFIQGALSADFNNDGFTDFVVLNYGKGMGRGDKRSPALLKNIDGEKFELIDLSEYIEPGNYSSGSWGDIDRNGFPDLYLTNYVESMGGLMDEKGREIGYDPVCFENRLLMNIDGVNFIESSEKYKVNDTGCGLAASLTDVDQDGDQDLLLLNDFGEWTNNGNHYFRNEFPEPFFQDVSLEKGFDVKMYGMGIGQGDVDKDGDPDYYITNIGKNYLYYNSNGDFTDRSTELGVDLTFVKDSLRGTSWSGLFFDADFDGDLDLFVSKGNVLTLVPRTSVKDENKFFLQEDKKFIDGSSASGLNDFLSHRGSVITDFDHDGDLDIISAVVKLPWAAFAKTEQKIKCFRNDLPTGNWIGVELKGDGKNINKDCFGCSVVFHDQGEKSFKEVDGGSGQASQSGRVIWYGLGDKETLERLVVHFPGLTKMEFENLQSGNIYKISPDGTIGH
jgi:hypothetical protein